MELFQAILSNALYNYPKEKLIEIESDCGTRHDFG